MKLNIGKLLKKAVRTVKANPEIAVIAVGLVAPKAAAKIASVAAKAKVAREIVD